MGERRYWIGVVSADHVALATAGGFVQLNHGKATPLERMRPGDGLLLYSPRQSHPDGAPLQQFTAAAVVRHAPIERCNDGSGDPVFRRAVDFLPSQSAPIRPLIPELTFIRSKTHWGAAFRFGFLPVPEADFVRIAVAMGCPTEAFGAADGASLDDST